MDSSRALVRFYAQLNDHLPPADRHQTLGKLFFVPGSVKDLIESFGVPHPEVELIVANGEAVGFSSIVRDGDRVAVYPRFRAFAVESALRPVKPGEMRFVLDVHLGRLAAYLRMIGYDAAYRNDAGDPELARISAEEDRVLLTRDRGLLMHGAVVYGYLVRETDSRRQLAEVVDHFELAAHLQPFTRCMACNGMLAPVDKEKIRDLLPARTIEVYQEFSQCLQCRRVYWKGSHYRRMMQWLKELGASGSRPCDLAGNGTSNEG